MTVKKRLMYDKETGLYQNIDGVKYQYPPKPKNPLVYDKATGIYQKESFVSEVRQTKKAKVERHSSPYAHSEEFLDINEVYFPIERTYATSVMNLPQGQQSDYIKNFRPSSSARYIGGQQSDYIKNFRPLN